MSPEEIEKLPLLSFSGRIVVVEGMGRHFWEALDYLKKQKVVGFDTETRPSFNNTQRHHGVALLQLSGADRAYLFRLKRITFPRLIYRILANPSIVKVGAACGDDIHALQRYGKFEARNFVDLQKIVWEWGIRDKSVKKMAANILGVRISKTQQLSNWEADELSEAQRKYAATDAWICREMYFKLMDSEKHPLTPEERIPPKQLEQQLEARRHREEKRAAAEAAAAAAQGRHRRRRRRRGGSKKKTVANDTTVSQKG